MNPKLKTALKMSVEGLHTNEAGVFIHAHTDFPYVLGYGLDGDPHIESVRALVTFTEQEPGLWRPWLRCPKCRKPQRELYMVGDEVRCEACWGNEDVE
jgi:hypothetical protein